MTPARGRRTADQQRHDLGQSGPLGFNKTAAIYVLRHARHDPAVLARHAAQGRARAGRHLAEHRRSRASASCATRSSCRRWAPTACSYLPYLTALFFFIFFSNITEIIPGVQFPANARFGMPLVLALVTWVIYNVVGVVKQGPLHYLKNSSIPPGVPKRDPPARRDHRVRLDVPRAAVLADGPALRQHARRPPHPRDVRGAVRGLCAAKVTVVILPFSFLLLVAMTGFEILVSFLQAFIFTILTAVYIGSSMHPEH